MIPRARGIFLLLTFLFMSLDDTRTGFETEAPVEIPASINEALTRVQLTMVEVV